MGVVAECTHLALNERVAIKMLRQDVLSTGRGLSASSARRRPR